MSLEQAVEENTKAIRELIVILTLQSKAAVHSEIVSSPVAAATGKQVVVEKQPSAEVKSDAATAITYKELSEAFLALIRKLGSAAEAKKRVLDPLGLADLKSNQEKTDLFPAIMEKIKVASKAAA